MSAAAGGFHDWEQNAIRGRLGHGGKSVNQRAEIRRKFDGSESRVFRLQHKSNLVVAQRCSLAAGIAEVNRGILVNGAGRR